MFNFKNTYSELPERFYQNFSPTKFSPNIITYNKELGDFLNIKSENKTQELEKILSAQITHPTSKPIAMAYAGHQFGNFVPSLGDGRAVLLGELSAKDNKLYDLHLKGAGPTGFSRGGDGLSPLGPALREYLISEAMFHLNIKTTRSLAVIKTGLEVYREDITPGAITARIASSHIRIGTFEYFAAREDHEALELLFNYTLKRLYPNCNNAKEMFQEFIQRQSDLIASWLSIGFIHGVMNTDNTSLSGETIDYGPCAFMDTYKADECFSYIDRYKRYAYNNQSEIMMWNISRLATCLIPLIDQDEKQSIKFLEDSMQEMPSIFKKSYLKTMAPKFGLDHSTQNLEELIKTYLTHLEMNKLDFTNSFRNLDEQLEKNIDLPDSLYKSWQEALSIESKTVDQTRSIMQKANPYIIPRNHLVQKAIDHALNEDYSFFEELHIAMKIPFEETELTKKFSSPPRESEIVQNTFCGT